MDNQSTKSYSSNGSSNGKHGELDILINPTYTQKKSLNENFRASMTLQKQ